VIGVFVEYRNQTWSNGTSTLPGMDHLDGASASPTSSGRHKSDQVLSGNNKKRQHAGT
ncbi:unnamed protein product, partial [Amoebophrya sp. A120]